MAPQDPEAFYAALKDNPIKFGKAQAVVQTPAGQDDQKLQLPNDDEVRLTSACMWSSWLHLRHRHRQRRQKESTLTSFLKTS